MAAKLSEGQPIGELIDRARTHEDIPFQDALLPIRILYNKPAKILPKQEDESMNTPILWHEQLEILFILEGALQCECDFQHFTAAKGDLVIANPCETHMWYSLNPSTRYHCMMIDLDLCGRHEDIGVQKYIEPFLSRQFSFYNHIPSDETAVGMVKVILDEFLNAEPGYELILKGQTLCLLAYLYRNARTVSTSKEHKQKASITPALRYVALHYTESISLADLSDACYMNLSYFCRKFHEATGRTAVSYINEYRLAKAHVLLLSTALPVTTIATSVGFSDNGYFARKFRQVYGISPSSLRNAVDTDGQIASEE